MKGIQLNPQQQEAVSHKKGPMIVLSVAGSGKTMVLTERIIEAPCNKAAGKMGTAPKGWDSKRSAENLPPHEDFSSGWARSLVSVHKFPSPGGRG
jgi:hypothetical protein